MNRLRVRSAFISDVHLGLPHCQTTYLLDFLRSIHCDHLYLVGDIVDVESLLSAPWWHPDHSLALAEIFQIAQRGTRVTYIPGNHDAVMRRFAGQSFAGIRIELDALHVAADGRRYKVSHGDEYDHDSNSPTWLLYVGDKLQGFVCGLNRFVNSILTRVGFPYQPLSIAIKSRIGAARRYIRDFEKRVASSARASGIDGHICGHIHHGRIEELEGVLYINDGDWVEHCTALVEHSDGAFELLQWTGKRQSLAWTQGLSVVPSYAAVA